MLQCAHERTILAIETSCDETAAAVISRRPESSCSNIVASQIDLHAPVWWGLPGGGIAGSRRSHQRRCGAGDERSGSVAYADLDAIAVTQGPGLGRLAVGGDQLRQGAGAGDWSCRCWASTTLEGHIYSLWLTPGFRRFRISRCWRLIVSGGHSELVLMKATMASMSELAARLTTRLEKPLTRSGDSSACPFPGGPAIERAATGWRNSQRL